MGNFGGINFGDARRAHLALIEGGASIRSNVEATSRAAASIAPSTVGARQAPTRFGAQVGEAGRSRHENGVRAVARSFETFDEALIPMVLASGVAGEAAASVAEAIKSSPALRAQAERAFSRARIDAV